MDPFALKVSIELRNRSRNEQQPNPGIGQRSRQPQHPEAGGARQHHVHQTKCPGDRQVVAHAQTVG